MTSHTATQNPIINTAEARRAHVQLLMMFHVLLISLIILIHSPRTQSLAISEKPTSFSLNRRFLVLLDRDGVINIDVGPPGVLSSTQLTLTPNAATAIGALKRKGHIVAVITNQSCVGKGLISAKALNGIHSHLQSMLLQDDKDATIDAFYACTSAPGTYDYRRKPNPGMIHEAFHQLTRQKDDDSDLSEDTVAYRERCVFIGDSWRDIEAAATCGIDRRILVSTGYGLECMGGQKPILYSTQKVVRGDASQDTNRFHSSSSTIGMEPNVASDMVFPFYYTENLSSAVAWLLGSVG